MKNATFKKILILSLLLTALVSCSNDDDNMSNVPKSVNDINLSFNEVATPETPEDAGNYSVWFSMIGDKIYYMNPSNTPLTQFMLEYNITNNSFSNKTPDAAICACGFGSQLITDGNDIYYIANDAVKYSPSSNSWSPLNYPAEFHDNNGEVGVAYLNGKIYFFGGRTAATTFKYYELATDSWHVAPDGPYLNETSELIAVDNTLYNLGGRDNADRKRFSSYNETNGWISLPDLHFNLEGSSSDHLIAVYDNRYIFAIAGYDLYVYDTFTKEWKMDPISIPSFNLRYENIFIQGSTMYLAGKSTSNEFALVEVDIEI